ncbi:hypothetical protein Dimus_000327 [Dionaea muscipula]
MRSIFCGNFEFDAHQSDLERLFRRYGKVDRVDMKSGFAFVYMEDERDAEYAIRALDRTEFGRQGRRLRVEWTKQERGPRRPVPSRRSANLRCSRTLFVINFPYDTRTRDLERHFDPYGKILNVRIRKNFAFVQYESQEDATRALDATNMSTLMDRVISVEYASRDDDDKRNGYSPDRRDRDRSPDRRRRSPSPYRRERGSPDYGHGSSPARSRRERGSPDYGNGPSARPHPPRRSSPDFGDANTRNASPRQKGRATADYRDRSQTPHSPPPDGQSPRQEPRTSSDYHHLTPSHREIRASPNYPVHVQSPQQGERGSTKYPDSKINPRHEQNTSSDYLVDGSSPHLEQTASINYSEDSPRLDDGEIRGSPNYGDGRESPNQEEGVDDRYNGRPNLSSYNGEEDSLDLDCAAAANSKLDSRNSPEYEE